jgi:hypothetical protein
MGFFFWSEGFALVPKFGFTLVVACVSIPTVVVHESGQRRKEPACHYNAWFMLIFIHVLNLL